MTLVILLALMTGLCVGLPHHDFDAAEIMLDSLSEAEVSWHLVIISYYF